MDNSQTVFRGAMRADIWNYTFPLVSFVVCFEMIKIKVVGFTKYVFHPEDLEWIKVRGKTIQLYHNIRKCPKFILFSGKSDEITDVLIKNGFAVSKEEKTDNIEYNLHLMLGITGVFLFVILAILTIALILLSN